MLKLYQKYLYNNFRKHSETDNLLLNKKKKSEYIGSKTGKRRTAHKFTGSSNGNGNSQICQQKQTTTAKVCYLFVLGPDCRRFNCQWMRLGLGNAIWNVLMCAVSWKYIFGKIFNICVLSACGISIPDIYALGLLPNWVCVSCVSHSQFGQITERKVH